MYWLVAAVMVAGALGSALSGPFWVLIGFRFLPGFGVGGACPVSAVMVSEYAKRKDRGTVSGAVLACTWLSAGSAPWKARRTYI